MNYKEKLKQFNSTDKYRAEMLFMEGLVQPKRGDKILDIGCGLGTMVMHLNNKYPDSETYCYDVIDEYFEGDEYFFRSELFFQLDKVYFMHSFAHIPRVEAFLEKLCTDFLKDRAQILIITPNKYYLDQLNNSSYIPDPTIYKHYGLSELTKILSDKFKIILSGQFGESVNGHHERLFIKAEKK